MMVNNKITYKHWGNHIGKDVFLFKIQNPNGAFVEITNYGATLVSIVVPDASGKLGNVILGFDSFEAYLEDHSYIGSTIGRFANRIANARFDIDGKVFNLEKNDGENTNHSGAHGFHCRVFDFSIQNDELHLHLTSPDGEGGYPGNLNFGVAYSFSEDNQIQIHYTAETDQKTFVNFTNHAYFNLNNEASGIFDHQLKIASKAVLESTADYIPTGQIIPSGPVTFNGQTVGDCLVDAKLRGFNTFYVFDHSRQDSTVAVLSHAGSGRRMEISTSYPGLMLYTGDYLEHSYKPFDGLCLECQFSPDSPNHQHFPSTILQPGEQYKQYIHLKFDTQDQPI
ncbi:aldose epimerase family protein [Pedobacter nutrimenti]|uniref:aldose epimerase family protein n=1 Tax=Pedobacter nutrimenti TaxID=1241337 RepID=UPI002930E9A3|nr:aldose epimerase family protein [Pedobacter nutrimenti]